MSGDPEQAVIVKFRIRGIDLSEFFPQFYRLEDRIERAVTESGIGELDGHELAVDGSHGLFYLYGADADALYKLIEPDLHSAHFLKDIVATLRYGGPEDPHVRQREVRIDSAI